MNNEGVADTQSLHAQDSGEQWDPLAPDSYVDDSERVVIDEAAPVPGADETPVDPAAGYHGPRLEDLGPGEDGSFTDPMRLVRVWLEDGVLSRVRVATTWKQKLEGRRESLADSLTAAVVAAQVHDARRAQENRSALPLVPMLDPAKEISFSSHQEALERQLDLIRRQQEFLATMEPVASEGLGALAHDGGVTVRLDAQGSVFRIDLSEAWLSRAETSSINHSVVAAARAARREFVPPADPVRQRAAQLQQETDIVAGSHLAWINRGGTSQ